MVNNIQIHFSLLHGLEYISNLIARCTLYEYVYDNKDLATHGKFVHHMTDLYAFVLRYLAMVRSYFGNGSAGMTLSFVKYEFNC